MKIGSVVSAAALVIAIGCTSGHAQTATTAATFTATVTKIDSASGTVSLTQNIPPKPQAAGTVNQAANTATGDYPVKAGVSLSAVKVGQTVTATVDRINGRPTITNIQ